MATCRSYFSATAIASIAYGLASSLFMVADAAAQATSATSATPTVASASCPALLNQNFDTIQGKKANLCQYTGKVLLVVNTASYCGFTKQYEGLQALYDKYQARGLVVIGFPANDFGKQEPGTNAEVADFCERTYKVKFPMMAKTSVIEGTANPLHEALAKATGQRPKWNFHKYLISRDGKPAGSFGSRVEPQSAEFVAEIEKLLASAEKTAKSEQVPALAAVK
jgi:glutathione peroxidase